MAAITNRRKNEKGQALVEFTLMFPILLAVILGLVAMSMIFYSYLTLQLAVREGTNAIVHDPVNQDFYTVTALVKKYTFSFDPNSVQVYMSDKSTWVSGYSIYVSATYFVPLPSFTVYVPLGGIFRFGPIPISAISRMTIE